uniref:Uncharacterized protein n=1 Tax=Triticum aestivum TaxID=4565 RepID=A0A3B6MR06_WHEAT
MQSYKEPNLWVHSSPVSLFLRPPPVPILVALLPLLVFSLLFRIPLFTGASAGLRWICPNHLSRCWTSFSSIGATPALSRIPSFLIWPFIVWPHIHLSMRISVTLICWMCCLLVGQHSAPYKTAVL